MLPCDTKDIKALKNRSFKSKEFNVGFYQEANYCAKGDQRASHVRVE